MSHETDACISVNIRVKVRIVVIMVLKVTRITSTCLTTAKERNARSYSKKLLAL